MGANARALDASITAAMTKKRQQMEALQPPVAKPSDDIAAARGAAARARTRAAGGRRGTLLGGDLDRPPVRRLTLLGGSSGA